MKKKIIFLLIILAFFLKINVKADSALYLNKSLQFDTESGDSGTHINKMYVASGKTLNFYFEGSTSEISWGSGEDAVLVQKQRVQKVVVSISSSGNVSCSLSNSKADYYSLSGNTFTLKDNNAPSDKLEGKIGTISCSLPTTDNIIKFSRDMYLDITLNITDIDIANDQNTTSNSKRAYKYQFGVANENYIKGLNDKTSITSITIDGKESEGMKIIDVDKESVTLKITQNELASKNQLYIEANSDKKGKIIKEEKISAGERVIKLPYGGTSIQISEETEKEKVVDELKWIGDDHIDTYGFGNSTFSYSSNGGEVFLLNRIDNRSKVNTLKSLSITGVSISFKPELKNYIASVPYKVSSVVINSVLTDPKSSYVKGYGNRTVNLKEGLNTVQVKVKAENESETTYTIKITREKNDDASLKSLSVDGKEVTLKNGLLIYTINVNNDVVKPTIKAVANDSKAKVEIEKFSDLQEGDNDISITVTASNGNKGVYVINVVRDKLISTNSKLKKIEIKDHEIKFNSDKDNYNVHINYDVEKLDLVIETDHEKAKYVVTGNKNLENGSVIKIKVTAEDEKTISTYTINVEKEKKPFNILYVIIPGAILVVGVIAVIISKKNKNKASKDTVSENKDNEVNASVPVSETPDVKVENEENNLDDILVKKKD